MSNVNKNMGELVEDYVLYGGPTTPLEADFRQKVIDYTVRFEECSQDEAELAAMSDSDLVRCSYWVMAQYARGQV